MTIGTFLLIILAIWIVPKLIRGAILINHTQRQARKFYEQMYNAAGGRTETEQPGRKRKTGWTEPAQHRKKIDPSVGEYVKFQEIDVEESAEYTKDSTGESSSYTVEQQVTDAEWEEI